MKYCWWCEVRGITIRWMAGGRCRGLGLQETRRQDSSLPGWGPLQWRPPGAGLLLAETLVGLLLPLSH